LTQSVETAFGAEAFLTAACVCFALACGGVVVGGEWILGTELLLITL